MNYVIEPNSGYWFSAGKFKAGDTILFKAGQHDYFSGTECSGEPLNPIFVSFEAGVVFSKGFDFTNCRHWVIDGGPDKRFYIKGANGVAMGFKGKCGNITIKGVKIEGCYSFIWFKTEVNEQQFANWDYWTKNPDGTISASYVMDGLTLENFDFQVIATSQDGLNLLPLQVRARQDHAVAFETAAGQPHVIKVIPRGVQKPGR